MYLTMNECLLGKNKHFPNCAAMKLQHFGSLYSQGLQIGRRPITLVNNTILKKKK